MRLEKFKEQKKKNTNQKKQATNQPTKKPQTNKQTKNSHLKQKKNQPKHNCISNLYNINGPETREWLT